MMERAEEKRNIRAKARKLLLEKYQQRGKYRHMTRQERKLLAKYEAVFEKEANNDKRLR